jgi:hypothetical protein
MNVLKFDPESKETRRAKDFKQKANTYTPVLVKQASR